MSKINKAFSADVSAQDGERAVTARISTNAVDRDGEVLVPQGMNAKDYQANPVVLFLHSYYSLPVGKVTALKRDDTSITAKVVFAERPENHDGEWVPDTLFSLYQQGVMNAFSVGFEPVESRAATSRDIGNYGEECRKVTSKWKLLELSCVPLPCNQEAVALAVSKGLVSEAMSKAVFGVEKGAKTTCPDCEEEYEGESCPHCAEKKSEPVRRVAASVDLPNEPQPAVKRIHRVLTEPPKKTAPQVDRKLIVAEVAKMRGRIYID